MENEMMSQVLIFTTILAPIVLALVEVFKKAVKVPVNILPIVSLGIGLIVGIASSPFTDMDLVLRLWAGGIAGLGGTGLYEVFRTREGESK